MKSDNDLRKLLTHLAADLNSALVELGAAYSTLDGPAMTREKQKAVQKRIRAARDEVVGCMQCYQALRSALNLGL